MHKIGKAINSAFDRGDWDLARRRLLAALKAEPEHHWLLSKLSAVYYEQRKYQKALEYARKAYRITPKCPLVQWDLAGALLATGKLAQALKIYRGLLRDGVNKAATCPEGQGEGLRWAVCLLLDCIFMIGVCYQRLRRNEPALRFLDLFLSLRQGSDDCVNNSEDAIKRISEIRSSSQHNGLARVVRQIKKAHRLLPA